MRSENVEEREAGDTEGKWQEKEWWRGAGGGVADPERVHTFNGLGADIGKETGAVGWGVFSGQWDAMCVVE